jgi:hypothetical protein
MHKTNYTVEEDSNNYMQYHIYNNVNSVAFSPQANYTDRATAACRRS